MSETDHVHHDITRAIIGAFYEVHWELGPGLLESVYANAMECALTDDGLRVDARVRYLSTSEGGASACFGLI